MSARGDHGDDQRDRLQHDRDEPRHLAVGSGELKGEQGQDQTEQQGVAVVDPSHAAIIASGADA